MEETTLLGRLPQPTISVDTSQHLAKKERALEYIVYLFTLLFTYAGIRKLIDLDMFVKEVWGFAIYGSKAMIRAEFTLLSCAELLVAIMLILPRTRLVGIYATFILIVTINICFFILQQYAKVIPMYYGGIIPEAPFIVHFIFNLCLLFLALVATLMAIETRKQKNSLK